MSRRLTQSGESALAVVAIEGAQATARLRELGGRLPTAGGLRVVRLALAGFEERAVVAAVGDGFEVSIHGNPVLVDCLLDRVGRTARPVAASLDAEIVLEATRAASRTGLRWCLQQRGEQGLVGLANRLAGVHDPELGEQVSAGLAAGKWLRSHLEPVRVVLRGRTNAGKSSLFNLLVGRERVRTGPEPSLTRDPVEEVVLLEDVPIRLVDTAGESPGTVGLDRDAIDQARAAQAGAELTVWVCSVREVPPKPALARSAVRLWTHGDLASGRGHAVAVDEPAFAIVDTGAGALGLLETRAAIVDRLKTALRIQRSEPALGVAWLNPRHKRVLVELERALRDGASRQTRRLAGRLVSVRDD